MSIKHSLLSYYLLLKWASTANCGDMGKIINGTAVRIESYPYQLSLQISGRHACGAALISSEYALTAAHCTVYTDPEKMSVRAGSSLRNKGGIVVQVARYCQHSGYNNENQDNDISLLQFEEPLNFTESIQPIRVISRGHAMPDGAMATISGWGLYGDEPIFSDVLRAAQVPIISQNECIEANKPDEVTNSMMCAGYMDGRKDACQGDSGGPLVHDEKLIGIVSWGKGCGEIDSPGVYTNLNVVGYNFVKGCMDKLKNASQSQVQQKQFID